MDILAAGIIIMISFYTEYGGCIRTTSFMANENRQGYDENLLIKTINKHFPEADVNDMKVLTAIVSSKKGQELLRIAAVDELRRKIETQQKRKIFDEPLNNENCCNYAWLSWLPWLSCPEQKRKVTPLRHVSQKTCY